MVTHHPLQNASRPALRGPRGFTLIELVMSIVLIGLLAAVGTTMISDSFDTTFLVNASQSSTARARYAMERMEREIREGKTVKLKNNDTGMTLTKGNGVDVVILRNGSTLSVDGATLIADEVTANADGTPLFTYLTATGALATAADHSDVRFVQIYLTIRDDATTRSGQTISQRTRVALRNAV